MQHQPRPETDSKRCLPAEAVLVAACTSRAEALGLVFFLGTAILAGNMCGRGVAKGLFSADPVGLLHVEDPILHGNS